MKSSEQAGSLKEALEAKKLDAVARNDFVEAAHLRDRLQALQEGAHAYGTSKVSQDAMNSEVPDLDGHVADTTRDTFSQVQ